MSERDRRCLRYLTHPQVTVDPAIAVPDWGLSDVGRERARAFAHAPCLAETRAIVTSKERKAIETAEILSEILELPVTELDDMHENDRSSTGFLPEAEFEAMADRFFAQPDISADGWERAIDAQARILHAVEKVLAGHGDGDLLMVGHGAVGTLLYCSYARLAIDRRHDQPPGGGFYFTMEFEGRRVRHAWRSIEDAFGPPPRPSLATD